VIISNLKVGLGKVERIVLQMKGEGISVGISSYIKQGEITQDDFIGIEFPEGTMRFTDQLHLLNSGADRPKGISVETKLVTLVVDRV
jgi:hypothetical protein